MPEQVCARTGKTQFASKSEARRSILKFRPVHAPKQPPPKSVYRCPACGMWHMTSKAAP